MYPNLYCSSAGASSIGIEESQKIYPDKAMYVSVEFKAFIYEESDYTLERKYSQGLPRM